MEGRTNELTEPMARVQRRLGRSLAGFLRERYHDQGATLAEIGAELGVSEATVSRWMSRSGIERRFPGQRVVKTAEV